MYHLKQYHSVEEQLDAGIEAWFYKKKDPESISKCCEWLMKMGYLRPEKKQLSLSQFNDDFTLLEEEFR